MAEGDTITFDEFIVKNQGMQFPYEVIKYAKIVGNSISSGNRRKIVKDLLWNYGHYFDEDSTLYRLISAVDDTYIFTNVLTWFEQRLKQIWGTDSGCRASLALVHMIEWLEKEMRENLEDPGGFDHSIEAAVEEARNQYAVRTKIVTLGIGSRKDCGNTF